VLVTEALLPPVAPGFLPRIAVVAIYAAWIAAGAYLVTVGVLALKRKRQGRATPLDVAAPALFASLGFVVLVALIFCAGDRFNHRLHS